MNHGIKWPDQTTTAFKDECVKLAEPLVGTNVTKKQKSSLMNRIIRPYAAALWIAGCKAPRVEGFTADIQLKSDAQPLIKKAVQAE